MNVSGVTSANYTGSTQQTGSTQGAGYSFAQILEQTRNAQTAKTSADGSVKTTQDISAKSIYNIPASELDAVLCEAMRACDSLDTRRLTKAEIYNRMEAIFTQYVGHDFREPNIQRVSGSVSCPAAEAYNRFESELRKHGIDGVRDAEVLKASRGYAGLSDDEIRASLRSGYSEQMTLRQCMNMAWDLFAMGIEEENYAYQVTDRIMSSYWVNSPLGATDEGMAKLAAGAQSALNAMLDLPADYETIKSSYDTFVKNDCRISASDGFDAFFASLVTFVGGDRLYCQESFDKLFSVLKPGRCHPARFAV